MHTAGYVLVGGASSRMGKNKAFLTLGGRTLLEIVATAVREAAGSVALVGPPAVYESLGLPVIQDVHPGAGPLAGIEAALSSTEADWNLIVACDMPRVTRPALIRILDEAARHPEAACVLPVSGEDRVEPLCAAYHKRCLFMVSDALSKGIHKVTRAFPSDLVHYIRMTDDPAFQNVNTPEEWRLAVEHP